MSGWLSATIALVALTLLLQRPVKIPEPEIVALGALAGIALHRWAG